MKIKLITKVVSTLLSRYEDLRDDDVKLIASIWRAEIRQSSLPECQEFFNILLSGRLSHPETIMRSRRKVQENDPQLRGKKYAQRQQAEKQWRKQIKMF